jgi:uncharacterized protein YegJ (DUF2314 family)
MRGALARFVESEYVRVDVLARGELPEPPIEMLRAFGMGKEEEARLSAAKHVTHVATRFVLRHPLLHLWAAEVVARAVAVKVEGLVLDPIMPRVIPIARPPAPPPGDGRVAIAKQIIVPMSTSDDGALWMTTTGMQRFGLPNLEMRAVPPGLGKEVLPLMNGVAQRLLHEVLAQASAKDDPAEELVLPRVLEVTRNDLAAAYGQAKVDAPPATTVGVAFDGEGRAGMEPFVAIGPPPSFEGERGEWYYAAIAELVGGGDSPAPVVRPKGDEALAEAHARAVRELPEVKARFERGLPPGATLYVKHGFEVARGGKEFMWIAVIAWADDRIDGALANDSAYDPELRAGKRVKVAERDVFDWMISDGKGGREGGYSIAALSQ